MLCCTAHEINPEDIGVVSSKVDAKRQPFMVAFFQSSGHHTARSRKTRETQRRTKKKADTTPADSSYSPRTLTGKTNIAFNMYEEYVALHWKSHCRCVSDSSIHWSSRSCQIQTLYVNFRDLEWHVSRANFSDIQMYSCV
jgi:bone morphogenetic protein 7